MKLKVIFVDLGGVLIINKVREVGEKYEKSYGLSPELTKDVFGYIQTAKRTEKGIETYLKKKNIKIEIWKRYLADFYLSESRNDDLVDLLKIAKSKGVLVVYTTNNSDKLGDLIKKYQINDIPDLVINSSEANVAKPDPEFWRVAFVETRKLIPEVKPAEILVIDDSFINCVSAEEFGFRSLKYDNSAEFYNKIETLFTVG